MRRVAELRLRRLPIVSETSVPIQVLVALLIAVILGQEAAVARRRRPSDPPTRRVFFFVALTLMAGAGAASLADLTRTWCDPTNHWIQGHALWHVLSAAALYSLFRFYQQMPPPSNGTREGHVIDSDPARHRQGTRP